MLQTMEEIIESDELSKVTYWTTDVILNHEMCGTKLEHSNSGRLHHGNTNWWCSKQDANTRRIRRQQVLRILWIWNKNNEGVFRAGCVIRTDIKAIRNRQIKCMGHNDRTGEN